AALVDLAWDRVPPGLDPDLARGHLDGCDDCREELELARESRRAESSQPLVVPRRRPIWPLVTLPATLAAGLVLGLSWPSRRETAAPPAGADPQRLATLQSEVTRLRGLVAELEGAARSPRLNLPVFELLPGALVRGGEEEATTVTIPAGAGEVALLLTTDAPAGTSATLVIRRGRDEVWRGQGLLPRPPGGYVVVMPADLLPAGSYVLEVQPQRGPRAVYALRVRRQP
ncbi:MAG TPA: hypothetical protein VFO85_04780, partial [Vicinamibacteria bacterium]|nr:hypothetical protein [Vicinamibacteria bacterium]